jgi:FkbM family methyltransferase
MLSILRKMRDHFRFVYKWSTSVGVSATARWELLILRSKFGKREPARWSVRPRRVLHPLIMRLQGSSDISAFDQIFVSEEYSCLRDLKDVRFVLDLGANVGYSSAYFLSCFPNSRVLAVEPDERNVMMCKLNLLPYGDRVRVLHGAVWSNSTNLRLARGIYGDRREWATQVLAPTSDKSLSTDVPGWDMQALIDLAGVSAVDLLKVDIERAELAVFGISALKWLPKVRNICIELHGKDCEEAFFAALKELEYELRYSGELTICRNLRSRMPV